MNVVLRDGKETAQFNVQIRLVFALAVEKPYSHMLPRNRSSIKIPQYTKEFYCFTVHFNSLNLTYQLMHFYIQ
jgi:hypothetical protein